MRRILILVVILMNTLGTLSARSEDSAIPLTKGQAAPYTGYEITPDQAVKVRNLSIDNDTASHINSNLTQENALLNTRLTNAQTQNESLSKQLVETRDSSFLSKAGFFILGAVITGAISVGVYRTTK